MIYINNKDRRLQNMDFQLSQKETMLLKDAKEQEELCVKKYQSFASQAKDSELKNLLNSIASQEQQHLNTINDLLSGKTPSQSGNSSSQGSQTQSQGTSSSSIRFSNPDDATLLTDLLSTEKYVSGFYDTSIFESANKVVRDSLQHIQKEEQTHGEQLFNYMNQHGMYNVK